MSVIFDAERRKGRWTNIEASSGNSQAAKSGGSSLQNYPIIQVSPQATPGTPYDWAVFADSFTSISIIRDNGMTLVIINA